MFTSPMCKQCVLHTYPSSMEVCVSFLYGKEAEPCELYSHSIGVIVCVPNELAGFEETL